MSTFRRRKSLRHDVLTATRCGALVSHNRRRAPTHHQAHFSLAQAGFRLSSRVARIPSRSDSVAIGPFFDEPQEDVTEPKPIPGVRVHRRTQRQVLNHACRKAVGGGVAGAVAMLLNGLTCFSSPILLVHSMS